jgi:hypothetical protein
VNIVWAALIVAVVTGLAVTAMLLVRRRAPDGGYFTNGDRASGVFGVLATGFSVLLGFLIFLAFDSYDSSRVGAETEALVVAQQLETAQLLPTAVREDLTGELICYARFVVEDEWARMEDGTLGNDISPWGVAMFHTLEEAEPESTTEEAAYGKWLDQTSAREEARRDRIHGAEGIIPTPLWFALVLVTGVIFLYLLCFADRGEPAFIQGLLMGSVVIAVTVMLLVLRFLNDPFTDGIGGVQPQAMERTIEFVDQALDVTGIDVDPPCDAGGVPS